MPKKIKTPWPTKDAMQQVYAMQLWGCSSSGFYSGEGSHLEHIIQPYIKAVGAFLNDFKKPLVVCDLGCGDFNIGKQLVAYSEAYKAVDIVPELIAYNKQKFINKKISFTCLDIAVDTLPTGDCALVRQVLQHLSNKEIQAILEKLSQYKYVILTEHIPDGTFMPNLDIISGQGIRLKKGSGVDVLVSPFNLSVKIVRELCAMALPQEKGVIKTVLYML